MRTDVECSRAFQAFHDLNSWRYPMTQAGRTDLVAAFVNTSSDCAAWIARGAPGFSTVVAVPVPVFVGGYGYGARHPISRPRPGPGPRPSHRNAYGYGYTNAGRNAGSYPARSDALSASPFALWWQSNYDGENHLCASQGITIVRQFQTIARAQVPLAYVVDGVAFSSADIVVDGNFGPGSFGALRQMLTTLDVPQAVLDTIANDWQRLCPTGTTRAGARGLPISLATMAAIIFVAAHRDSPWSSMSIPSNMRTLAFAQAPGDDGSNAGTIVCAPFAQGAAGLGGADARPVAPGGATPTGTPTTTPGALGSPPASSGGGGSMVLIALLVVGAALAMGKKRL